MGKIIITSNTLAQQRATLKSILANAKAEQKVLEAAKTAQKISFPKGSVIFVSAGKQYVIDRQNGKEITLAQSLVIEGNMIAAVNHQYGAITK